eukprot:2266198-Pyramimonas_sp.AAC.1
MQGTNPAAYEVGRGLFGSPTVNPGTRTGNPAHVPSTPAPVPSTPAPVTLPILIPMPGAVRARGSPTDTQAAAGVAEKKFRYPREDSLRPGPGAPLPSTRTAPLACTVHPHRYAS